MTTDKQKQTVRELYEDNWARFENSPTVELDFLDQSPEQQYRLNRFKLWALEHGDIDYLTGKDILEFGAGHGRLALEIPVFASYTGVDLSPHLVRIGQRRLSCSGLSDRAPLIACDCLAYEGPEAAFDVVCSLGMFEDLVDPAAVLRKMVLHLKPSGILFFDVHYSSPLYDPIRKFRWRVGLKAGGTRRLFTRKQLLELCHSVGLTNVRIVMREFPFLGKVYARTGWEWPLQARNLLAAHSWLNVLGVNCFVFGSKKIDQCEKTDSDR